MNADVIVIGAGAAGLAAARSLARRRLHVIVLEARDRVGGRAWSVPTSRTGVPAELGAEFIHGRAETTIALLREAGIVSVDTGGEMWSHDERGAPQPTRDDFMSAARIFNGVRALQSDETVDEFLQRYRGKAEPATVRNARKFVEGFDAADPAIASVKGIAHELESGVDFSSARPVGGYRHLFEHMRKACISDGVELRLSTVVRRVAHGRGNVEIDTTTSGEPHTIGARAAIVTLPSGVLRHSGDATAVTFAPVLPEAKRAALEFIETGHVVKVVLWFKDPYWERIANERYRDGGFFRADAPSFQTYWTQLPIRTELIVAWVGGPGAGTLNGLSSSERIAQALHGFGSFFGDVERAQREFDGGATHNWTDDEYARGAYSYLTVGGGDARAILASPVNDTLFFAGEATSTNGASGTVDGALQTGERAAREVAAILGAARV